MGNRTVNALVGRGIDTETAERLAADGHTLTELSGLSASDLERLGLSAFQIEALQDPRRPPIPPGLLIRVLHDSRRACVICRGANRSVVVHHITPWSEVKTHEEENLVVLCLEHHGEAHTRRDLSRNLTAEDLLGHKKIWLEHVRGLDAARALGVNPVIGYAIWDYFNLTRLPAVLEGAGIKVRELPGYDHLLHLGVIGQNGALAVAAQPEAFSIIESVPSLQRQWLTNFYEAGVRQLLSDIHWIDLKKAWSKIEIKSIAKPGSLFVFSSDFYFTNQSKKQVGSGQSRGVFKRRRNLRFEASIDAWETFSTSAYYTHLTGHQRATCVGIVRSLSRVGDDVVLQATLLAIGSHFDSEFEPADPGLAQLLREPEHVYDQEDLEEIHAPIEQASQAVGLEEHLQELREPDE